MTDTKTKPEVKSKTLRKLFIQAQKIVNEM